MTNGKQSGSRERVEHYQRIEGLGTRTPIRFGSAAEKVARHVLPSWERLVALDSDRYLLYMFRRPVIKEWIGTILIQGARRAGKLTAELAISRRPVYPVHYGRVRPFLGVDGVRERVAVLHNQEDLWWDYRTQETLEDRLKEIMQEVNSRGFYHMDDMYGPMLRREIDRARTLLGQWLEQEPRYADRPLGSRYPDLMMERQAYEYIDTHTMYDSYNRILGPLRQRYADPRWTSCQTYLMATLMEMSNLEELEEFFVKLPTVVDDEIHVIGDRVPVYMYLKPPESFEDRVRMYAYFKSLNICEAFFDDMAGVRA